MKFERFELYTIDIKAASPLAISFHSFSSYNNFLIRLITQNSEFVGWGEGAPFAPITGDTREEAIAEAATIGSLPSLDAPEDLSSFLSRLTSSTLQAAFDMALHDLIGRYRSLAVFELYTPRPRAIPNSVTVFLQESAEATVDETTRILNAYPHLQVLKIKLKGEQDVERVSAIKEATMGRDLQYILDANQGFHDEEQGLRELELICHILGSVLLIEEPCPKGSYAKMRFLHQRLKAPIFADESCATLEDLERLVEEQCVSGINIKLQKAGGLTRSRQLANTAADAGLSVMIGQMFEGPLSTAASVNVASTLPNALVTDLDMDLDLPGFSSGKCRFEDGCRAPSIGHGLDFALDEQRVAALTAQGLIAMERVL